MQTETIDAPRLTAGSTRREKLEFLRDFMAGLEAGAVNLNAWHHESPDHCGSVGCVGGWAGVVLREQGLLGEYGPRDAASICQTLDIDINAQSWLFDWWNSDDLSRLTKTGWDMQAHSHTATHHRAAVLRLEQALCMDAAGTLGRYQS